MENVECRRTDEIGEAVREAVRQIVGLERTVIEGYYFDGMSLGQIARSQDVSLNRAVTAHRQALRRLRVMLAPLVERMFGIGVTRVASCPVCVAEWRHDAEGIMDSKTADQTWGVIMTRIERATGWRAASPQVLIAHQRKHRTFQPEGSGDDQTDIARGTCIETEHFDRAEAEFGEIGEDDGSTVGGCLPSPDVDGAADFGGIG